MAHIRGKWRMETPGWLPDSASLRSELLWTLVLSLGAATILAMGSAMYISRLEKETRLRYDQVAAGRVEMGKLSHRLVAAQEQERKSISRELHDEVGQTLNALLVDAGNLQKRIPESDAQSRELLNSIQSTGRHERE